MDTRKIQSVGSGTYTVSLPKEWSNSQDITAGDIVNLHQYRDGILAVQTQEADTNSRIQLRMQVAPGETEQIKQTLQAAYIAGIKEITLTTTREFSTNQQQIVNEVSKALIGVSVVETSKTEIVVQVLLNREQISIDQIVSQIKFIALSMHETAIKSLTVGSDPEEIATRDDQINRLYAMVNRLFERALVRLDEVDALGYNRPALFELWETTRELERVADHAKGIATTVPAISDTIPCTALKEVQAFGRDARMLVSDAVAVVVDDAGIKTAHETLLTRDELCKEIEYYTQNINSINKGLQLLPALHRVRRTAEHGGNIAEIGLKDAVRRDIH